MAAVDEILYRKRPAIFYKIWTKGERQGGLTFLARVGVVARSFPRSGLVQQDISWTEFVQSIKIIAKLSVKAKNMPDS